MKLGVNAWVWTSPVTTDEFAQLAPKVAEMGFELIEVGIESTTDLDYARGAEIAREHGLDVSLCAAMSPDRDLIHPDDGIRKNGMNYVRHCIEAARTMGATNVIGPIYSAVGRTWQSTEDERRRDTDLLVEQLRQLSVYAADHGVVLCIEPLNRFETSFMNLAEQAIEVVDRVGSPSCGILLDTFHMNIEEKDSGAAIKKAGKHLGHFHACGSDRGTPGNDHIDWTPIVKALKAVRYTGPVVIESFTTDVKVIARAAAIWRTIEPKRDDIAVKGVKFLRKVLA